MRGDARGCAAPCGGVVGVNVTVGTIAFAGAYAFADDGAALAA